MVDIKELQEQVANYEEFESKTISSELITNNAGKQFKLLENTDENFTYVLRNKYYSFKFEEPVFIEIIIYSTKDESTSLKGFKTEYVDIYGKEHKIKSSEERNIRHLPRTFVNEFKFKAPEKIFGGVEKIELKSISIVGYTVEDFQTIQSKYNETKTLHKNLESKVEEIEEKTTAYNELVDLTQKEHEELVKKVNELRAEKENYETEQIPSLKENFNEVKEETEKIQQLKDELEKKKTTIENNIKQLEGESDKLNTEIGELTADIRRLNNDKNVFSTEMVEYVKQANNHMWIYFFLAIIPWVLIAYIAYFIFFQTEGLIVALDTTTKSIDMWKFFLARLPFVFIVASIVYVSYRVSKIFIHNLIHIQKQKRQFAKIGIIAKDVADSSMDGMEITPEEKFQLRTKLRMDLLKSHLSSEIGKDYEHKINLTLWEAFQDYVAEKFTRRKNAEQQKDSDENIE